MKSKNPYREKGYAPVKAVVKPNEKRKSGVIAAKRDLRVK